MKPGIQAHRCKGMGCSARVPGLMLGGHTSDIIRMTTRASPMPVAFLSPFATSLQRALKNK
jgi:hypothetical protein